MGMSDVGVAAGVARSRRGSHAAPAPLLPTEDGGVAPDENEIYHDLKPFVDKLDLKKLCRDAFADVDYLWERGAVRGWCDANMVIEQHAPHRGVDEGTEGIQWDIDPEQEGNNGGDAPNEEGAGGGEAPLEEGDEAPQEEADGNVAGDGGVDPKPALLRVRTYVASLTDV